MRPPEADATVGCWFELSRGGTRVAPAGAAWTGSGLYARCSGGYVEVRRSPDTLPLLAPLDGCAPAWLPLPSPSVQQHTLTLVRDGEVVACVTPWPPLRCETAIARDAIEAAARQHPNVPDRAGAAVEVAVVDLVWLSRERAVLLLRIRIPRIGPQDLVAVFEAGRVRGSYYFSDTDRNQLEASPHGRYVAAGTGFAARADGPRLAVPNAFGRVRELAWSPDERWLALAARGTVALVRVSESSSPRVVTLPLDAADVGWAPG
ncbi:MAG TPA: hypothetical protein VK874_04295 [Gaiellaceae bacterium]|nr:hypothetical protein [Gaiellaceae bacterium]